MQNRQHRAVGGRVEKLIGMPCGRQRSRFRLAVADHASDDEIGIIEYCSKRMTERIAQFSALRGSIPGIPAKRGWEFRRERKTE